MIKTRLSTWISSAFLTQMQNPLVFLAATNDVACYHCSCCFFSIKQGHVKHGTWGVEATGDGSFTASWRSGTNLHEFSPVIFVQKKIIRTLFVEVFLWHSKWQSEKNPKRLSDSVFYWSVRRIRYFLKEWFAWGRRWMRPSFSLGERVVKVVLTEASISVFNGEEGSLLSRSCGYVLHRKNSCLLCACFYFLNCQPEEAWEL